MLALKAATWSNCQAAGSFQRPEPRVLVTAGFAPNISMPNVTGKVAAAVRDDQRGRTRWIAGKIPPFPQEAIDPPPCSAIGVTPWPIDLAILPSVCTTGPNRMTVLFGRSYGFL
jgi:hypothetical protein